MGKAHSKYIFNPPKVDPMFRDIGCVGLKRDDYKGENAGKLAAPPFLYYKFTAKTYREIQLQIGKIFQSISPTTDAPEIEDTSFLNSDMISMPTMEAFISPDENDSINTIEDFANKNPFITLKNLILKKKQTASIIQNKEGFKKLPPITGNGNIYGPVYFLIAQDPSNKSFEGFLYFPSMTKNKTRYRNYIELGVSHRWMHTLLYSRTYARTPVGLIPKKRENTKCETYNYTSSTYRGNKLTKIFGGGVITKIGDPLKYGCRTDTSSGDTNTARACMETEEILREQGTFKDGSGYNAKTGMDYGTDVISSEKSYYPAVYFHTYQLDTSKPSFAPYMNSKGFDNLQLNIMVSDMDMYYGCDYMLISPNSRVMFNLNKNSFALFINTKLINPSKVVISKNNRLTNQLELLMRKLGMKINLKNKSPPLPPIQTQIPSNPLTGPLAYLDLNKECYDKPRFTDGLLTLKKYNIKGTGNRYIIENTNLNVYALDEGDVEEIGFTIEIVNPNIESQPPYSLLLDDTGRLRVYDNNDKEVTSPKLVQAFAYDGQPNPDGTDNLNRATLFGDNNQDIDTCYNSNEPYNPGKNYRCRLLNLIAYLQYRGLLKDLIGLQDSENPDENIQQFKIIYEKVATFNSTEDYIRRIIDLVNYIEIHYQTTIDENLINSYYDGKGIKTTEQEIVQDQRPIYDKVSQYNEPDDIKQRMINLQTYMKSYNILKDEPIYDVRELEKQSQQLPLASQLDHNISKYDKDKDYEQRLMNLQSYYPVVNDGDI
jgi:hypothetical protein